MITKLENRNKLLEKVLTEKLTNLILISALLAGAVIVTSLAEAQTTEPIRSRVDPLRRSYLVFETDNVGSMTLQRVYSSRSIFRGHFGIGWCSSLDARVVVSGTSLELRGCDLQTADRIDHRRSELSVQRTATGFRRDIGSGQAQLFDPTGRLMAITKNRQSILVNRNSAGRMTELVAMSESGPRIWKVAFENLSQSLNEEALIRSIGPELHYQYRDGLLTEARAQHLGRDVATRMAYDEMLNLSSISSNDGSSNDGNSNGEDETITYNSETDELTSLTRTTALGRDRLLLGVQASTETMTSQIEIRIEMKRGVEIHPVRILYDRRTRDLVFEGSRKWARRAFDWLSA